MILAPSRVDESFAVALEPSLSENYSLSIRPSSDFSFDKARQKILKLSEVLPYSRRLSLEIPDDVLGGDGGGLIRLGGIIEWNKQVSVRLSHEVKLKQDWMCWSINHVPLQT